MYLIHQTPALAEQIFERRVEACMFISMHELHLTFRPFSRDPFVHPSPASVIYLSLSFITLTLNLITD